MPWVCLSGKPEKVYHLARGNQVYSPSMDDELIGFKTKNKIVGFIAWRVLGDEAEFLSIAVDKDMHGQGIGKQLLQAMLSQWQKKKLRIGLLEVRASNMIAQHLYQQYGFELRGCRRNYYPSPEKNNQREDALIMVKEMRQRNDFAGVLSSEL